MFKVCLKPCPIFLGFVARKILTVTTLQISQESQHQLFGRIWADLGVQSKVVFCQESLGQGIF